jgi:hypothetical protein
MTLLKPQPSSESGEERLKGNVTSSGIPPSSLAPPNGTVTSQWSSGVPAFVHRPFVDGTESGGKRPSSRIHMVAKATVPETQQSSGEKERRHMSTKWLGMTFKRQKQDAPNGKASNTPALESGTQMEDEEMDKDQEHAGGNGFVKLQGDLQSVEDIYRAAGIMNPRMGYSVSKVVEMINSDHMRGLPNEAKRAAVFMALDAAGVSVEEVLRDATLRQTALNAYESAQRSSFEEYWARKVEGNAQIQAELDRLVAQNLERIKRNLDEVAAEKAGFATWQAMKRQEAERMSEAVALCSKQSSAEPAAGAALALTASGSPAKLS